MPAEVWLIPNHEYQNTSIYIFCCTYYSGANKHTNETVLSFGFTPYVSWAAFQSSNTLRGGGLLASREHLPRAAPSQRAYLQVTPNQQTALRT